MDAIAKVVEGISAEISSLKEQRHAAHAEAERAGERLKELSGQKAPLPSGTSLVKGRAGRSCSQRWRTSQTY